MKYRVELNLSVEVESDEGHMAVREDAERAATSQYYKYFGSPPENTKIVSSGCFVQLDNTYTGMPVNVPVTGETSQVAS